MAFTWKNWYCSPRQAGRETRMERSASSGEMCESWVGLGSGRVTCSVCDAVGRSSGSYFMRSVMSSTASAEALGMICASGVGTNCGKRKDMLPASRSPSPHVRAVGEPSTEQILYISSASDVPGKSGRRVKSSARMQPHAHWSIGLL